MRVCSLEVCFTRTEIISSASFIFHGIKDATSRPAPLVTTFSYTIDTTTLSLLPLQLHLINKGIIQLHLRNFIQFVGRRQLPVTFVRTPTPRFSVIQFFKLSAKYISPANSTHFACLRRMDSAFGVTSKDF